MEMIKKKGVSELRDRLIENAQSKPQRWGFEKRTEPRDLRVNTKVPASVSSKSKGSVQWWKNIDWSFPNLEKHVNQQNQEAQQTPERINSKRFTPGRIILKLLKTRHTQNSWSSPPKCVPYRGAAIQLAADFSFKTMEAKMERRRTFNVLKEKGCQPRNVYPEININTFRNEDERRYSPLKES